jgi:hypothetical protein
VTTSEPAALIASAISAASSGSTPELIDPADPDWVSYQADDPQYFLRVAGKAVRAYCGWHLYPNLRQTLNNVRMGARGRIMLRSRRVTQVDSLAIMSNAEGTVTGNPVAAADYVVYEDGWIQLNGYAFWTDAFYSGYYYGNDPYYVPVTQPGLASVTFWHGYDVLPENVKQVAFELAEQAATLRSGNVRMLEAPGGYRVQVSRDFGLTLNPDQMDRLANYRIGMVG